MTTKEIKDPSGKVVARVVEHDGVYFNASVMGNIVEQLKQLNEMTFRDSVVCIVSYPKSG